MVKAALDSAVKRRGWVGERGRRASGEDDGVGRSEGVGRPGGDDGGGGVEDGPDQGNGTERRTRPVTSDGQLEMGGVRVWGDDEEVKEKQKKRLWLV